MGREDNKQKLVGRLCYVPDNVKIGGVGTGIKKHHPVFLCRIPPGVNFQD